MQSLSPDSARGINDDRARRSFLQDYADLIPPSVLFAKSIRMEDKEGEGGTGSESGNGNGTGSGEGGTGEGGTGSGQGGSGENTGGQNETVSRAEFDRIKNQLSAADRRATQAEQERDQKASKLQEIEDKDKSALELAERKATEAEQKVSGLESRIQRLSFDNAMLRSTKFSWKDPNIVLDLVRKRDDVKLKDDGTIEGLDKALEDISKSHDFLLNKKEETPPPGKSGENVGGGNNTGGGKEGQSRAALESDFPALRGRRGRR